jgi:hypothetical protein
MPPSRILTLALAGTLLLGAGSCTTAYRHSVGIIDTVQVFTRIYLTDFNTAWQAVLDALKNSRLDISNREGGIIQTRWTDNTSEKNFTDSFGDADSYLKAQYRVRVTVAKGFFNGRQSIKVTVQKEQLYQRDVLEGWRPSETDSIDENTLLYRIGRIIYMRMRMGRLEEEKTRQDVDRTGPPAGPDAGTLPPDATSGPSSGGPPAGPDASTLPPDTPPAPDAGLPPAPGAAEPSGPPPPPPEIEP